MESKKLVISILTLSSLLVAFITKRRKKLKTMRAEIKTEVIEEPVCSRDSFAIPYDPSFELHIDFSKLIDTKAIKNPFIKWWPYAVAALLIAFIYFLSGKSHEAFTKRDYEQQVSKKKDEQRMQESSTQLFLQQTGVISNQLDSLKTVVNSINAKIKVKK